MSMEALHPNLGHAGPASGRHRQASYQSRLRAAGLVPVAVWVPVSRKAELSAEAERLRLESGLTLPGEDDPAQLDLFTPDHTDGAPS